VTEAEGERPLRRPRHWWVENIVVDLRDEVISTELIWLRIGTGGGLL
jgi:hypothetical protein